MISKIKKTAEAIRKTDLNDLLWAVMGLVILINIGVIFQSTLIAKKKTAAAEESARPANISLTIIKDSSCADCASLDPYINEIKKNKVKIMNEKTVESSSEEGKNLIKEFDLKKLPAFVAKGELDKFDDFKKMLAAWGRINKDNFVFASPVPNIPIIPYIDIASGQVKGRVNLILISDKSCAECQDAQIYKSIIARFGIIKPLSVNAYDKTDSQAKDIIKKYRITALPTFILNGEVSEYQSLAKTWPQVGSIENDGYYIFRKVEATGMKYFDLKAKKVVDPRAVAANLQNSGKMAGAVKK